MLGKLLRIVRRTLAFQHDCIALDPHGQFPHTPTKPRFDSLVNDDGELAVAVGRPGNDTPMGRFSVTDKLRVTDPASPYGCCVLALSGHQINLPAGWTGGDRLAVHATQDLASIGQAASLGCLRAGPRHARWLIETIPLGAPVFVRS